MKCTPLQLKISLIINHEFTGSNKRIFFTVLNIIRTLTKSLIASFFILARTLVSQTEKQYSHRNVLYTFWARCRNILRTYRTTSEDVYNRTLPQVLEQRYCLCNRTYENRFMRKLVQRSNVRNCSRHCRLVQRRRFIYMTKVSRFILRYNTPLFQLTFDFNWQDELWGSINKAPLQE